MSVISRSVSEIFVSMAGGEREFGCTVVDCMSLRGVKCLENVILFTFCCTCSSVPESSWNPHGTVSGLPAPSRTASGGLCTPSPRCVPTAQKGCSSRNSAVWAFGRIMGTTGGTGKVSARF